MRRLSVTIITLNEADRLARTLEAVAGVADEIVLVDSGSTDQTVAIAEQMGAKVHINDFEGYGQQKRFAEDQCEHDWILNLDADEVVTPELAAELLVWKADEADGIACYEVDILNIYPGETKPRPLARDYRVVRLYDKTRVRYRDHPLFDRVDVPAGTKSGRLQAPVHHFPIVDFSQMIAKANRLSSVQAKEAKPKSRWQLLMRLWLEYPFWFLKTYFLRMHVLGGWKGFVFAQNQAYFRMMRIAKMLEKNAKKN